MQVIELVPLSDVAPAEVETLLDAAFGVDRRARTAYRLRDGTSPIAALSFAALDGGRLIGSIQCWPVALERPDGSAEPLAMVGPVAVAPDAQGKGVGKALMEAMLAAAKCTGYPGLMMIGDPDYYGRFFGFTADATAGWSVDGPVERHRLLARIAPGRSVAVAGRLRPACPE